MSDRLKLSDPKGDAEVERVASALEQREDNSRIRQLEQNIAALERELARKKGDAGGSAAQGSNNKIGARKHASFKAISTAPSINKTPIGPTMVPIPYPVVQDLSSSVNTARTVKFNGCPVYLLDGSTQPHCTGDEPGTGKGIKSGTVSGEVKPVKGCSTVRVEGKQVVREGDACTMNGGNNPGVYVTTCTPSSAPPKDAIRTSNPPTPNGSTPRKGSSFESWNHDDPLGLFSRQTAAEKLAAEMQRNTLGGNSAMTRTTTAHRNASVGPRLTPWDPSAEGAKQQRTRNNLNIALLGPFGVPGTAARMSGANEDRVAAANEVGGAAMGVAWSLTGLPGRQPISVGPRVLPKAAPITSTVSSSAGVKIVGTGGGSSSGARTGSPRDVDSEITALKQMARKLGATTPGPGERSLTKEQYRELISKYRSAGDKLQSELEATIASQTFVYRATTLKAVDIYRANGRISGRGGGVYMSTEYVGLEPKVIMDKSQVFEHWGQPEVLLRIPTSEIDSAVVPRPFGDSLKVGWEPRTEAYPTAGSGDMNQFLGTTKSWSDSWVIPLKGTKTK